MIKIELHNRKKCIACAYCENVAPELFFMDYSDGKCRISTGKDINQTLSSALFLEQDDTEALEAEKICPVKIIRITKLS